MGRTDPLDMSGIDNTLSYLPSDRSDLEGTAGRPTRNWLAHMCTHLIRNGVDRSGLADRGYTARSRSSLGGMSIDLYYSGYSVYLLSRKSPACRWSIARQSFCHPWRRIGQVGKMHMTWWRRRRICPWDKRHTFYIYRDIDQVCIWVYFLRMHVHTQ